MTNNSHTTALMMIAPIVKRFLIFCLLFCCILISPDSCQMWQYIILTRTIDHHI
jgi:hypothetical protein